MDKSTAFTTAWGPFMGKLTTFYEHQMLRTNQQRPIWTPDTYLHATSILVKLRRDVLIL